MAHMQQLLLKGVLTSWNNDPESTTGVCPNESTRCEISLTHNNDHRSTQVKVLLWGSPNDGEAGSCVSAGDLVHFLSQETDKSFGLVQMVCSARPKLDSCLLQED